MTGARDALRAGALTAHIDLAAAGHSERTRPPQPCQASRKERRIAAPHASRRSVQNRRCSLSRTPQDRQRSRHTFAAQHVRNMCVNGSGFACAELHVPAHQYAGAGSGPVGMLR